MAIPQHSILKKELREELINKNLSKRGLFIKVKRESSNNYNDHKKVAKLIIHESGVGFDLIKPEIMNETPEKWDKVQDYWEKMKCEVNFIMKRELAVVVYKEVHGWKLTDMVSMYNRLIS